MGMKRTEFIMNNVRLAHEYSVQGEYCAFYKPLHNGNFTYALMKQPNGEVYGIKFVNGRVMRAGNSFAYLPQQFTVALMLKAFPEWI